MVRAVKKKAWIRTCINCEKKFKKTGIKDTLCPKCWFNKNKMRKYSTSKGNETLKKNQARILILKVRMKKWRMKL